MQGDVLVALQGHRGPTLKWFVVMAMLKKTQIWGPGPPGAAADTGLSVCLPRMVLALTTDAGWHRLTGGSPPGF